MSNSDGASQRAPHGYKLQLRDPAPPVQEGPKVFDNLGAIAEMARQTGRELFKPPEENGSLTAEEKARHRVYLLLVMRIVREFWRGNRNGSAGIYNYRAAQRDPHSGLYDNGLPYYGHNIAAIAVDSTGRVTDFDFNHSEVFRSSIEHAEARLVRRLYSLSGVTSDRRINEHTIYTTLEPCAQCAGIMALAGVSTAVYLQSDDGTRRVSNILYNLKPYSMSVRPITAAECDLPYGPGLDEAYIRYQETVMRRTRPFTPPFSPPFGLPFWEDPATGRRDWSTSIASFLCTDVARELYEAAAQEFDNLPDSAPQVAELRRFLRYAISLGHRGTAH